MTISALPGSSVRSRVPFEPIVARKPLQLPGNARVAIWTIVNVENWSPLGPMPRTVLPPPMGGGFVPDVPNWAWHEYGMRVGFWRFLDVLERRSVRATLAVNGSVCTEYESVCRAAVQANWEFIGHGFQQTPLANVADERAAIVDTVDAIEAFTGSRPRGWESPGLVETDRTLDLLAEAGIDYVADWVIDDQPVEIRASKRPLISIPYSVEINDVVISAVQQCPAAEIFRRGRDQFDQLYKEGATSARVMAISIHPYLTGVPHRIRYLEQLYDYILSHDRVVMWTGSEIVDWYREARVMPAL